VAFAVGELRGLLSIKLPAGTVKAQARENFSHGLGIHLAGFIAIFWGGDVPSAALCHLPAERI